MMKLGVSYNLFDGEELLEGSIKCIRDQVDYISVVYQTISNFGNPCNPELVSLLSRLKEQGLVDELFEYKPRVNSGGHFNEITKRNIGLSLSTGVKCTHHMSMDSDEYYLPEQFKFLKEEMINGDYDSSFCQMKTYYKTWEYQLDPPEEYYVSLIYKINQYSLFEMGKPSPVLVDPTRRMESGKYRILERDEIEMHHGSYVRNNIRTKLENSSASVNFKNDIEKIVSYYNNWKYPNKVLWGGLPSTLHNVKKIKNLFNKKNEKLTIVVPYRNREEHLKIFIDKIPKFLNNQNFDILIVEQFDAKPFNRAKLLNIGFDFKKNESDYFCFHDIDMIPTQADYSYPDKPYHMATNVGQFGGSVAYPTYYGGVNLFNKEDFIKINGYSNDFWGWGGEDDDLLNRIKKNGFDLYRRNGHYLSLKHVPNGPNHSNYNDNIKKLSNEYDYNSDGINTLTYELVNAEKLNNLIELIKVKI